MSNKINFIEDAFENCLCYTTSNSNIDRDSNEATVLGTEKCVFSDIERFGTDGDVFAVNDAGFYVKDYKHMVSAHGNMISLVKQFRSLYRSDYGKFTTHTALFTDIGLTEKEQLNADYQWSFSPIFYSSGILAIYIAIALGYESVKVHGIPMDDSTHFYDFNVDPPIHYLNFYKKLNTDFTRDLFSKYNVKFSSGNFSNV